MGLPGARAGVEKAEKPKITKWRDLGGEMADQKVLRFSVFGCVGPAHPNTEKRSPKTGNTEKRSPKHRKAKPEHIILEK